MQCVVTCVGFGFGVSGVRLIEENKRHSIELDRYREMASHIFSHKN